MILEGGLYVTEMRCTHALVDGPRPSLPKSIDEGRWDRTDRHVHLEVIRQEPNNGLVDPAAASSKPDWNPCSLYVPGRQYRNEPH